MNSNTPSPSAAERTISHDEAREAALALIDHWFQNANGRRVQTRIPVDPTDTDVVLTDYIEQQRNAEAELSRIRTLLSSIESVLRKHPDFNLSDPDFLEMQLTRYAHSRS